jgi:hypothetical protein
MTTWRVTVAEYEVEADTEQDALDAFAKAVADGSALAAAYILEPRVVPRKSNP